MPTVSSFVTGRFGSERGYLQRASERNYAAESAKTVYRIIPARVREVNVSRHASWRAHQSASTPPTWRLHSWR
jgi:hypothetical protein